MAHPARRIALALGLLALWLQLLAPALASGMRHPVFDGRATICHGASSDSHGSGGPEAPHSPACDHCVLCHVVAVGPLPDGRPVFTLFDYPVSSPARWSALAIPLRRVDPGRDAQPRGPPILA